MSDTQVWIAFIILVVTFLAGIVFLPQWLLRRGMRRVIALFRRLDATSEERARTAAELGVLPRSTAQNLLRGRDYNHYALQIMIRSQIILITEDERLYLSEANLAATKLVKAPPP